LAYNPYRVNVGSIGMRTVEHKHDFISPAYVVFSCRADLLPEFLCMLFKTGKFTKIINENTTGSIRENLSFDSLKRLEIALPPREIQKKLLETYTIKTRLAYVQEKEAMDKEQEIDSYLSDVLGVNHAKPFGKTSIRFTSFSFLDRWGADYLSNPDSIKAIIGSSYPAQKLRNFLLSYQYGSSFKASEEPIGVPILRMNNVNNGELDIDDLKYIPTQLALEKKILLDSGDLLFNRTNSKELVGKTAVFDMEGDYTFASYLIRLKLDAKKVNVHFINYLFNSPIVRMQIDQISRQSLGQANVNAQELQDFIFPIPDRKTQNEIVRMISRMKEAIHSLKEQAELNQSRAIKEFEAAIFKQ
jgi:type I restriction enzyme, S subunit